MVNFLNRIGKVSLFFCLVSLPTGESHASTTGKATWYSYESCRKEGTSGRYTASLEKFDHNDFTCAMRSRDFGRYYKVTNLSNNRSVIVRHNDFGPSKKCYSQGKIIDLSKAAFRHIAPLREGVIRVRIEPVKESKSNELSRN